MPQQREIHLKSRPQGMPTNENFELVTSRIDEPSDGQVLVRNSFMSVDPYMRSRMRERSPTGAALLGTAVGEVVSSNNDAFPVGGHVSHGCGWRDYYLSDGTDLALIDTSLAPASAYLGVLGMPGLTAYGGLLETGELKDGESVFVSAASGAVGSVVGQIAKIKGCTVVGSAGSDEKVKQLVEKFGFDHGFNYKTSDPLTELRKATPEGIDVYFENVGGVQLEAALTHMRPYGRIPICGMISTYNDDGTPTPGPSNLTETIYKFVTLRGFVVSAFEHMRADFVSDMTAWISSGKLKYHETIVDGLENAPSAFIGLFSGTNNGKMLVRLGD